jgi:hypothetical protein
MTITPSLIPPATTTPMPGSSPAVTGVKTTVWVQALHFGVEVRY